MKRKNELGKIKILTKGILEWTFTLLASFIIAIVIKNNVFAMPEIKESSMENTFFEGEKVVLNRLSYAFKEPKRGDVIILNKSEGKKGVLNGISVEIKEMYKLLNGEISRNHLLKRIVGVPGDLIDIKDGYVYLNGEIIKEFYIKGETSPRDMKFPITVPDNKVFVLGDNREVSLDSRELGFIDYNQIEGKVVFRIWPINKIGTVYENKGVN
ncbi:signal peptidase I [Tissierella sp. MSJ-40]|uniref:Signal peptidase I n=1 Tax=Tissierella simiarum TaxID=2841534 RepID=A0ABS6E4Z0_9FIRM|nr:signal peptidase I [Tissierella simiarum]MBU5437824.1 signal peptidase I [Tissierella simiarum]